MTVAAQARRTLGAGAVFAAEGVVARALALVVRGTVPDAGGRHGELALPAAVADLAHAVPGVHRDAAPRTRLCVGELAARAR